MDDRLKRAFDSAQFQGLYDAWLRDGRSALQHASSDVFSTYGNSSCMIASPYGPTFGEFTAYESSKYGLGG